MLRSSSATTATNACTSAPAPTAPDDYGLIIEGAILAVGEAAIRPSGVFALDDTDVDFPEIIFHIR